MGLAQDQIGDFDVDFGFEEERDSAKTRLERQERPLSP